MANDFRDPSNINRHTLFEAASGQLGEIEPAAAQRFPSDFTPLLPYASAGALSLVITALIVAGYHRVLPRAMEIPSAINPSAIA